MDTTSLELSKELWKLSGWNYSAHQWLSPYDDSHPVYDLGYLLRKLHEANPDVLIRLFLGGTDIKGNTDHSTRIQQDPYHTEADTPEDAAAKLAIELFKHGVLKRES